MVKLTSNEYRGATSALFPDNGMKLISAARLRAHFENTADSFPFKITGKNVPPTSDDDNSNSSGNGVFQVGDIWIDESNDVAYIAVDVSKNAAIWKSIVDGSGGGSGNGDMLKSVYDTNDNGIVDLAEVANSVDWSNVQNKPATFAPSAHTHISSEITDITPAGQAMITAVDSAAQTALLDIFTDTTKGLVPSSGGVTTNFLRADGTWVNIRDALEAEPDSNILTDNLKTKLESLPDGNLFLGMFDTLGDLQTSHPSPRPGSYAMVGGYDPFLELFLPGVLYVWDEIFQDYVKIGPNSSSEIKSLYESNLNTNVFTDSEKAKLAGIEDGATADMTAAEIEALLDGYYGDTSWRTGGGANSLSDLTDVDPAGALGGQALVFDDVQGIWIPGNVASGDMLKSVYDTNDDGIVDLAEVANSVDWSNVANKPTTFTPAAHTHTSADLTDITGAGQAMITAADAAAQTALLNVFSTTAKGLVPASGGSTSAFLRGDGTWATPATAADSVVVTVQNQSGGTLAALTAVGIGAFGTSTPGVVAADPAGTMPAVGILSGALNAGATGPMVSAGRLSGVNTSAWALSDKLYVSTGGALTNVRPTGGIVQAVAVVTRVDAAAGELLVLLEEAGAVLIEPFMVAISDESSDLAVGTAELTFRMPYAFTLTDVRASVTTAPTGSVLTVDVNANGTSVLSTPITIDAGEKTSVTAATPPVIGTASIADDAEITIDIDTVGSTVPGAGLKVTLYGYRT